MPKSIVYYTDHNLPSDLADLCAAQLNRAAGGLEIVTVGLNKPADFGNENITLVGVRGVLTMHHQILAGLEKARGDIVFMAEHDVLYHPSHFEFEPERQDTFYYNTHVWHARYPDGFSVFYDAQQVSGLCASRALLLEYYTKRIGQLKADGFNRHYEPGLHQTVGGQLVQDWLSEYPNIDVRHGENLTPSKWSPGDFRNPRYARGWRESDTVPGWGRPADVFAKGVIIWD